MRLDGFEVVIFLEVFLELAKAAFERPQHGDGDIEDKAVIGYTICHCLDIYNPVKIGARLSSFRCTLSAESTFLRCWINFLPLNFCRNKRA